ncbi:hypothetical protein [Methylobacterium sp. R2-1]|uniref:hypothetical protein n=1 Tax=Methylobacterium sp. R2-1 TaxID=2587064 RepID=UPI0016089B05|nr:hypothetical protein [Methylobacterium sp. R2-1]MBB2963792.1 putative ribosome biogenesis GTPase RsgA [Methylobacterium sp. R2-1]
MNVERPYPTTCPPDGEPRLPAQAAERTMFDIEVGLYDALGLVKQAADTIHDLQRWKATIEPQTLSLIQSVQQERAQWQLERTALLEEIRECRLTTSATKMALQTALAEKEMLLRRYHDAKAAAAASEERAGAAEDLLAFIYQTFHVELGGASGAGKTRLPSHAAGERVSPE